MQVNISEKIPQYVKNVMDALSRAGYHGYLVGGSLRDLLRGVEPHDFDMTTDATPAEMEQAFADFRVIPTGLAHGTLTVLSEGNPIEVTTHRCDGAYLDARHPESVSFTRRLADDLSRRDFTVNAMAWNDEVGLVDLFGGQEDLAAGVIRAVGDPATRFSEDALRILRAFRFSAQLDFVIDGATLAACREVRAGLAKISVERVLAELTRLLAAPAAARGLSALLDAECAPFVFGNATVDRAALPSLTLLPPRAEVRLAALLFTEAPSEVSALCRRLHASNAFCATVVGLLEAAHAPLPTTAFEARRFAVTHWQVLEDAFSLLAARGAEVTESRALCRTVARDGSAVELRRLAVNGRELQEGVGVLPAKTAALLSRLQELVWQEPARNKKAVLLALAAEIVKEESWK